MSKFDDKLIDELLKAYDCKNPNSEVILGENGIIQQFKKKLLEKALKAEMTHHLGYDRHSKDGYNSGNSRNGTSSKKIISKDAEFEIEIPRDKENTFESQIIKKHRKKMDRLRLENGPQSVSYFI